MLVKGMPRVARITAASYPHHITQRGNYRQRVFKSANDYKQYLSWLKEYSEKYSLDIWAYCLMPNHVHFVCVPQNDDSLARAFNTLHMRYAQYINKKQGMSGHLWQGRFYSCILDELHLHSAVRYVEMNPVRAGIVKQPEDYLWSSAGGHMKKKTDILLCKESYLSKDIPDWGLYLMVNEDTDSIECIRAKTRLGHPCGENNFMKKLEKKLGRKLNNNKRGRPRKIRMDI